MDEFTELYKSKIDFNSIKEFQELREIILDIEKLILKNRPFTPLVDQDKYKHLKEYYETTESFILNNLENRLRITFADLIEKNRFSIKANSILIEDSCYKYQKALIECYNMSQARGIYDNTTFENGMFLESYKKIFIPDPPAFLYINQVITRPNCDPVGIAYRLNKRTHEDYEYLMGDKYNYFKRYLIQEDEITHEDYELIKEYFYKTAPLVVKNIIDAFYRCYAEAKENNTCVRLSVPMVNITDKKYIAFTLEMIYNLLFTTDFFYDTILNKSISSIIKTNAKNPKPVYNNPLEEKGEHQYNLCLEWNPYKIDRRKLY